MINGFSFSPDDGYTNAYTWMNQNIGTAASFLDWLGKRGDIAELVILGDLFDGWLCPMHHAPTRDFMDILKEPRNAPVINALRALCRKDSGIAVSYVPGNHDMLIDNIFTPANGFETLNFIRSAPGMGVYKNGGVIFAEHGSRVCLFNAPDTWSHSGSHLPEGFFMTTVAAEYAAQSGTLLDFVDILGGIIKTGLRGTLPNDFLDAIGRRAATTGSTFLMDGLDGFSPDPAYNDVLAYYAKIYEDWGSRQDIVPSEVAPIDDLGTLVLAANWIILTGQPYSPKILIFGHTHNYGFHGHHKVLGGASLGCEQYKHIYANAGTWIDGKTCTYIEVEPNASEGIYYVRGYSFENAPPKTPLDAGCVKLGT
jgi:UDP-2,3-diacylglucosamine pyrophosphatase LpxH